MADSWSQDPRTRLFLPGEQMEALHKAALGRASENRRQFFSDRNPAAQAAVKDTPNDEGVMRGDFMSYLSVFQPWNLAGGYRKPTDTVPFPFLREVAKRSVIDRLIIDTRIAQVKHFARPYRVGKKQVGFRVVHKDHHDPEFHPTADIKRRCEEVQARLANITPEAHSTIRDVLSMAVDEELTIDRKVAVIYRDGKGRPEHWHLLDGAYVKPRLQVLLPWMFENKTDNIDLAAEIVSYDPRFNPKKLDITKAAYVQEIEGRFTAAWTAEQMSVDITNPTVRINNFGYGTSLLEKSLESTTSFILAWNFNREMFKTNFPEAILAVLGDYDPAGLEAFKRQILGEVGQGGNWRLPVIPGGPGDQFKVEVQKLRDTPQEMLFGEMMRFLVAMKAGAYRMHPSEINFSSDQGGQQQIFGTGDTENEVANATEEGLHTLLDGISDWLTRAFVQQNYDDLVMVWEGLDRPNEAQDILNLQIETQAYKTVDEARAERGQKKLPNGLGEVINNPVWLQWAQAKQQEELQKQQAQQYDKGDFGVPDGDTADEPQESGNPVGGQQWDQQDGSAQAPLPGAKVTKTGSSPGEPQQLPPEGNPTGAPMMQEAARGNPKALGKSKSLVISFEED
jgi:hypothetical protein